MNSIKVASRSKTTLDWLGSVFRKAIIKSVTSCPSKNGDKILAVSDRNSSKEVYLTTPY